MSVLTLLLALFAWLLGPFAPLVPFAHVGVVTVAGAFWVYESDATVEARPIEAPVPAENEPLCFGEPATIVGRGRLIEGTDGDDVIVGGRGRNTIHAGAGDDLVCGGGNDQLIGGDGHDRFDGGPTTTGSTTAKETRTTWSAARATTSAKCRTGARTAAKTASSSIERTSAVPALKDRAENGKDAEAP